MYVKTLYNVHRISQNKPNVGLYETFCCYCSTNKGNPILSVATYGRNLPKNVWQVNIFQIQQTIEYWECKKRVS